MPGNNSCVQICPRRIEYSKNKKRWFESSAGAINSQKLVVSDVIKVFPTVVLRIKRLRNQSECDLQSFARSWGWFCCHRIAGVHQSLSGTTPSCPRVRSIPQKETPEAPDPRHLLATRICPQLISLLLFCCDRLICCSSNLPTINHHLPQAAYFPRHIIPLGNRLKMQNYENILSVSDTGETCKTSVQVDEKWQINFIKLWLTFPLTS